MLSLRNNIIKQDPIGIIKDQYVFALDTIFDTSGSGNIIIGEKVIVLDPTMIEKECIDQINNLLTDFASNADNAGYSPIIRITAEYLMRMIKDGSIEIKQLKHFRNHPRARNRLVYYIELSSKNYELWVVPTGFSNTPSVALVDESNQELAFLDEN